MLGHSQFASSLFSSKVLKPNLLGRFSCLASETQCQSTDKVSIESHHEKGNIFTACVECDSKEEQVFSEAKIMKKQALLASFW